MLFGAVGMVGLIGASTMTVMKGPVTTMSQVTKRTIAENSMIGAGKLSLLAATQAGTGDCDTDTTVEPLPYSTDIVGLPGGGEIPASIGVSKQDPWGTEYGYCVWDHGTTIDDAGCGGAGQTRLQGVNAAASDEYVIAIVSAGPDRTFNTACVDYVDVAPADGEADSPILAKAAGSDDLVLGYTYSEAGTIAGGLWVISNDATGGSEIANTIAVEDAGGVDQFVFDPAAQLLTIGDGVTGSGQFPITQTDNIRRYNGAVGGSINVDSALSSGYDITTTANISGADLAASGTLDVDGSTALGNNAATDTLTILGNTDITGDTDIHGNLSVDNAFTANSLASTTTTDVGTDLSVGGNSTLTGTLGVTGNTTLGVLGAGTSTLSALFVTNNADVGGSVKVGNDGTCAIAGTDNGKIRYDGADVQLCENGTWITISSVNSLGDIGDVTISGIANNEVISWNGSAWVNVDPNSVVTIPAETDPQVNTLSANDWCVANASGTAIDCNASLPGEIDPQVNTLTSNQWCSANAAGTAIDCTNAPPGGAGTAAGFLVDADADTLVQVEEGADDDTIRFDTEGDERMVILNDAGNGFIGINDPTPIVRLHVRDTDLLVDAGDFDPNTSLLIEHSDARIELASDQVTASGSSVDLSEMNLGAMVDKWSIMRRTSIAASNPNGLEFRYGANVDGTLNSRLGFFTSTGQFGVGAVPDASAILQADAADQGFLAPRMSDPTTAIAAPTDGLMAYNTTTSKYQFYDAPSAIWRDIGEGAIPTIPADSIDWDDMIDAMTLDATTSIDMDTNVANLNFDSDTFVINSAGNNIGLGTAAPNASAILDMASSTQGFLAPRMSTVSRDLIAAPAVGLTIYNLTTDTTDYWNGTAWVSFATSSATANQLADADGNTLVQVEEGANDDTIRFDTNGNERAIIEPDGDVIIDTTTLVVDAVNDAVGIGTATPNSTAILDLTSGGKGFLAPRMTTGQRDAIIGPASGLMVYNITDDKYQFYDATAVAWRDIGTGAAVAPDSIDWDDIIDAMTLDATTTIDMDTNAANFNFDSDTFVIDSVNNRIGVGTNAPDSPLHIGDTSYTFAGGALAFGDGDTGLYENADDALQFTFNGGDRWFMNASTFGTATGTGPGIRASINGNAQFITRLADLDTGLGRPTANVDDTLALFTGGAERIFIDTDGKIGVGTSAPDASSMLQVDSTDKGFLAPRVSDPSSAIAAPATGLIAYNTVTDLYQFFDGTAWRDFGFGSAVVIPADSIDWDDITDTMTLDATTTIDMDTNAANLNFDSDTFVIDSVNNRIGLGTNAPNSNLEILDNNNSSIGMSILNLDVGATASTGLFTQSDGGVLSLGIGSIANNSAASTIEASGQGGLIIASQHATTGGLYLQTGTAPTTRMQIEANGNVGIGSSPDLSAILDASSTDKGFLAPRVSDPTSAIAAPATGLIAYNTVTDLYQFYDGTAWRDFGFGAAVVIPADSIDWDDITDTMTLDATTTIDMDTNVADLNFDSDTFVIDSSANRVGMGINAPTGDLHLHDTPYTSLKWTNGASGTTASDGFDLGLGATVLNFELFENLPMDFWTNATQRMRIDADGDIGIGTTAMDASAAVQIDVADQGFLAPRVSDPTTAIAAPATGLIAYNTVTDLYQFFDGTAWRDFGFGSAVVIPADSIDWDDITDTMTLDATTTIDMDTNVADLNFDSDTFVIDSDVNSIGIGTAAPNAPLEISSTSAIIRLTDNDAVADGLTSANIDFRNGINQRHGVIGFNNNRLLSISNDIDSGNAEINLSTRGNIEFNTGLASGAPERMRIEEGGSVSIGTGGDADASALLEIASTDKGFLAPRVSDPTTAITTPATGLIAYNTVTDLYQFYDGTAWRTFGYGGPGGGFIDDLGDATTDYVTDFNMFMGDQAGASIIAGGQFNLAIGQNAGTAITDGDNNIAFGFGALSSATTLGESVAIGVNAAANFNNLTHPTTNITAIGHGALENNPGALATTAIGFNALNAHSSSAAHGNTAIGANAIPSVTSSASMTAVGGSVGIFLTGGSRSVLLGTGAGRTAPGPSTIDDSVYLGYQTGTALVNADHNVIIGSEAGNTLTTGEYNILIGSGTSVSGAVVSHELNIGDLIYGNIDDATTGGINESQLGIGVADATAIDASALVEFDSTDRGFLAPRVSDPASAIATPATGLMAYDTATDRYQYYDGTTWQDFGFGVGGDNLGNHTATTDLDMGNNNIVNPTVISFNGTVGAAAPTK